MVSCVLALGGCRGGDSEIDSSPETGEGDADMGDDGVNDDGGDDSPTPICMPGQTRCGGQTTIETCAPTGLAWAPSSCAANESCITCRSGDVGCSGARCAGPCDATGEIPASAGCSFYSTGMMINRSKSGDNVALPDAVVVANPNPSGDATINVYLAPVGSNKEELVLEPFVLGPGETHAIEYLETLTDLVGGGSGTSKYQSGGVYHVVSDLPIIAYLHTPYQAEGTNESSLLLPESALGRNYIIYNYTPYAEPGYFVVIAVEDQTTVRWRPTVETAGNNLPLPFVEAGKQGEYTLNRLDTMRIAASAKLMAPECEQDLSGTIVESDKPIMVMSAVVGVRVPYCNSNGCLDEPIPDAPMPVPGCADGDKGPYPSTFACCNTTDHIQEVNIPLEYWGKRYVGAHSPLRGAEDHYWRVFAGDDNTTVTTTPAQPGTPLQLAARGDWAELVIPSGTNVVFEGDKPFMPVQFLARHDLAKGLGDAAMTQSIPVEQWLKRYAFVTGVDYGAHYVQVIRESGTAAVLIDGVAVDDYAKIGGYEVANVEVSEGSHVVVSDDPFGIVQFGWRGGDPSAYAYPGGLRTESIFLP